MKNSEKATKAGDSEAKPTNQTLSQCFTMPLFAEDFDDLTADDFEDDGERWIQKLIEAHKKETP